ncbi:MAG TPA: hypothetical protein VJT31_26830, partial [Rugosimonospora sp.]|nr:hypothetical protein [Rugosimonospora sp.]
AAARAEDGPVPAAPTGPVRQPSTARETAAVAFLTLGSCIPVAGWVVGVILLWTSPRWRIGEKLLGTLVVPGGPGGVALFLALFAGQTCTSVSPAAPAGGSGATTTTCTGYSLPLAVGIPVLLVAVIAPFVVDGILLHRASKRAQ